MPVRNRLHALLLVLATRYRATTPARNRRMKFPDTSPMLSQVSSLLRRNRNDRGWV
jgi:hypothetical protein